MRVTIDKFGLRSAGGNRLDALERFVLDHLERISDAINVNEHSALIVQVGETLPAPEQSILGFMIHEQRSSGADRLWWCRKNAAGALELFDISSSKYLNNFSTGAQSPAAATLTYITGSALAIPSGKLQIGSCFRWRLNLTKTAAGVAASTFDVRIGVNGTTADAARLTFTKPAGTAAADEGWIEIYMTCRGPLSASGVVVGQFNMIHNLQNTGHMVIPCASVNVVSAAFDVTVANLIVGLSMTSGAADAVTLQMVQAEAWNL